MTCVEASAEKPVAQDRASVAAERSRLARAALAKCHLCGHHCGVNRLLGATGRCHAGAEARFFSAQVEVAEELELIPTFAIALSGCDLRCDFCITGGPSWSPREGAGFDASTMAARARQVLQEGARSVMLLGGEPTIHLPVALEFVAAMPAAARLVWKTNAHASAEARALLDGMFDVWVADFKFGNDACAARLAGVLHYLRLIRENLVWASGQSDLIVRHLLMPGHVDCCWRPVAQWLAGELPGVKVSLRTGFWPAWRAARHRELMRTTANYENARAWDIAREYGLNLVE